MTDLPPPDLASLGLRLQSLAADAGAKGYRLHGWDDETVLIEPPDRHHPCAVYDPRTGEVDYHLAESPSSMVVEAVATSRSARPATAKAGRILVNWEDTIPSRPDLGFASASASHANRRAHLVPYEPAYGNALCGASPVGDVSEHPFTGSYLCPECVVEAGLTEADVERGGGE